MLIRVFIAAAAAWLGACCFGQSAFTYQGRLEQGGAAYSGLVDIRARVFDSETGGSALGGATVLPGVSVEDGLFTIEMDFGVGVFDGSGARWIEIEVRQDMAPGFEVLGPRQRVLTVPRAQHASAADVADMANSANTANRATSAAVADVALSGPFAPRVLSSSGLPGDVGLTVELEGNQGGNSSGFEPVTLLSAVTVGDTRFDRVFEVARPWREQSSWFPWVEITMMGPPDPVDLTLLIDARGSIGRTSWEIECELDDDGFPYELRVGADGTLLEVLRLEVADTPLRFAASSQQAEDASSVPMVLLEDRVPVNGFGVPTLRIGPDVPALSSVVLIDSSFGTSMVQGVFAEDPFFRDFFSSNCVTDPDCVDPGDLVVIDRGNVIPVRTSNRAFSSRLGWALYLTDDGLPVEEYFLLP